MRNNPREGCCFSSGICLPFTIKTAKQANAVSKKKSKRKNYDTPLWSFRKGKPSCWGNICQFQLKNCCPMKETIFVFLGHLFGFGCSAPVQPVWATWYNVVYNVYLLVWFANVTRDYIKVVDGDCVVACGLTVGIIYHVFREEMSQPIEQRRPNHAADDGIEISWVSGHNATNNKQFLNLHLVFR